MDGAAVWDHDAGQNLEQMLHSTVAGEKTNECTSPQHWGVENNVYVGIGVAAKSRKVKQAAV
jgi:hypothetical protein